MIQRSETQEAVLDGEARENASECAAAEEAASESRGLGVSEVLRKAVMTGLGAAIMTEEGVRSMLKELRLPKDAVNTALEQAERGKEELVRIVNDEVRRFLDSPALKREIAKALSNITIELTAKIRLNPDGSGPEISFGQPQIRRESQSEPSSAGDAETKPSA